MKKIFILFSILFIAQSVIAQLDTVAASKLTLSMSFEELFRRQTPTLVFHVNQKIAKKQYFELSGGFILGNLVLNNTSTVEKVKGQVFRFAYRYQKEPTVFKKSGGFIGLSFGFDHYFGSGRTTYRRADGQFFQRYPFSNRTYVYSIAANSGAVFHYGERMIFELGAKLGVGFIDNNLTVAAPESAQLTDPNSITVFTPNFKLPDEEKFILYKIFFKMGIILK